MVSCTSRFQDQKTASGLVRVLLFVVIAVLRSILLQWNTRHKPTCSQI